MRSKLLSAALCLGLLVALTGCLNPFAKVGEKSAIENQKNVDYLAVKLEGYYKKDLAKKVLTEDDFKDRMVPLNEAKGLAKRMTEAFKK
jgi:hypothetical protein